METIIREKIEKIIDKYFYHINNENWYNSEKIATQIESLLDEEMKKAFEAGKEHYCHYSKSGMDTGYYEEYETYEEWREAIALEEATKIINKTQQEEL